jgi:hypothetical protein
LPHDLGDEDLAALGPSADTRCCVDGVTEEVSDRLGDLPRVQARSKPDVSV